MGRIRSFVNAKSIIAVVFVLAAGAIYVASLPGSGALAAPGVCTYYSSATYQTAVGARGTGCCGTVINWGVTSAYKKCQTLYCTQQICPN